MASNTVGVSVDLRAKYCVVLTAEGRRQWDQYWDHYGDTPRRRAIARLERSRLKHNGWLVLSLGEVHKCFTDHQSAFTDGKLHGGAR